ncbi:MAG: hypothetical protein LBT21_03075 [Oscillospiraceae bacterium]|nr:hypothetical protein [Oscillospiraceae bacterium]
MLAFSFAHLYADNPFYDINEYAESLVNMFGENWQEHGLGNNISELDISNNVMLSSLACGSNNISSLDLSKLPNLDLLACADNNLTTLDVSQNPKLTVLWCSNNYLTVESTEIGAEHTLLDESFSNYFYVEQATPSANFWFYPQKTITPPPTQKYHDFDTSETLIVDVPLSAAEGVYNFSLWQGGNGAPDLVVNSDGVYVHDGYIAGDLYLNGNDLTAANKLSVGGNIYINGSGVTLSNFSCNGTIYINAPGTTVKNGWAPRIIVGAGVGDGEVFINQYATAQVIRDLELTNATVPDLFIYGGGSHSVVVTNSVFGNVYVDKSEDSGKETVTVKLFGNTQIDALELLSDANIVTDADSAVTNLTVNSTAKNVAVTGGGTIVNAVIARGSNVSFENPPQNLTDSNLGATQTWWSQIAQWFTHIFEQITGFFKQVFGI